jgi:hypothetical protein
MQTWRLTIGPDGQVRIPDGKPGDVVTVLVETAPPTTTDPGQLTLATAKTPEEQAAVIARIRENGRVLRELLKDDLPTGTDELYGEDGLPA